MTEISFAANESGAQEVQLAPGLYHLTASASGYYSQSRYARIAAGATTNVDFTLNEEVEVGPTKYTLNGSVAPLSVYRTVTITKVNA